MRPLCLLLVLLTSFIYAKPNGRLIGAEIARGGQFPYKAAIYATTNNGRYFCGGALISNQWIITAAQCVRNAINFQIHLGSNVLSGDDVNRLTLATGTYILHPEFDPISVKNDVALIKLHYINAINLPTTFVPAYASVIAVGWGQVDDFNTSLSNELRWVELTTISNDECELTYGSQITHDMACVAGNSNEGLCNGDTGSPLIQIINGLAVHIGIASFRSHYGCETVDPSGYTRTLSYIDWIKKETGIL